MDGEIDIIIIQCVVKSLALAVGSIKLYKERKNIMKRNEEKIFDIIIFYGKNGIKLILDIYSFIMWNFRLNQ